MFGIIRKGSLQDFLKRIYFIDIFIDFTLFKNFINFSLEKLPFVIISRQSSWSKRIEFMWDF